MTNIFNNVAEVWKNYAIEYIGVFFVVLGANYASKKIQEYRSRQAILKGKFNGTSAIYGETLYVPTGERNPRTGREFIRQNLRNYDGNMNLEEIFHPLTRKQLMRIIHDAARHCTQEQPLVFQHLPKVVAPEELEQVRNAIARPWVNYFSTILNHKAQPDSINLGPRQALVEEYKIPVLAYEPDVDKQQLRVLLIPPSMLEHGALPDASDTIFTTDHHRHRLESNRHIVKALQSDPNGWLMKSLRVYYATGEVRTIPEPPPLPEGYTPSLQESPPRYLKGADLKDPLFSNILEF